MIQGQLLGWSLRTTGPGIIGYEYHVNTLLYDVEM